MVRHTLEVVGPSIITAIVLTCGTADGQARMSDRPHLCEGQEWDGRRPPLEAVIKGQIKRLCGAQLNNEQLTGASLSGADLTEANLSNSFLKHADLRGTSLWGANLNDTFAFGADLRGAQLGFANLEGATLSDSNLSGAALLGANLRNANLSSAILTSAIVFGGDVSGTNWARANVCGFYFEPEPKSLESARGLGFTKNLWSIRYNENPEALVALREQFKKAGLRDAEREVTFAYQRTRALRAWYRPELSYVSPPWPSLGPYPRCPRVRWADYFDRRPEKPIPPENSSLSEKLESAFSFIAFNVTCAYGMYPARPLRIVVLLVAVFSIPYLIALNRYRGGGIYAVASTDRMRKRKVNGTPMVRVTARSLGRIPGGTKAAMRHRYLLMLMPLRVGLRVVATAVYFSLLSAFQIGWRELNVGNWITRLQAREYTLRATGWVRVVSGVQSLLSVYLLALWVLTYFGRPFE